MKSIDIFDSKDKCNLARIEFKLIVAVRAPIVSGSYVVNDKTVEVSYESHFYIGINRMEIPVGMSTVFKVCWDDEVGKVARQLLSTKPERFLPLYEVLEYINELFLAYKLVRIGHIEGVAVRTIGFSDLLHHWTWVDGKIVRSGGTLRIQQQDYPGMMPGAQHPEDNDGTTELARPHIGTNTFPLARRYVRCFELIDYGFYTESLLVAFSILDDQVQEMLYSLLKAKGLETRKEQEQLIRSIKESRLAVFLGPVLKVIGGKSLSELWEPSSKAIEWINRHRNEVAHNGTRVSHGVANVALFVCLKTLAVLHQHGYLVAEFPEEMFRTAKILAAWSSDPPAWVSSGGDADS